MALSVAILRNRDFRLLMATRFCVIFALQAQAVIVGWQVYTLTRDPLMLGLIGLAEAVPAIIFALFAGHLVDISRPYVIYISCLFALVVNTLLLLLLAGGFIPLTPALIVPVLFSGVFFSGLARSFIMPASFALLAQIVPRHHMPAASAWLSSGFQVAAILGPAIAGLIYGGYGHSVAWFIPMIFMATALTVMLGIAMPHRRYRSIAKREPAIRSIIAGWKFIIHQRVLLSVMTLDMFAVLFGGAVAMLPAFADAVLHTGSEGLGLLRAAPAAGSIITALYFALKPMKKIHGATLLWVVVGFGASMIGFGLSETFWVAAFFIGVSGAFDSISMVIRGTLMQLLIPEDMRGRVSSVNSMFIISSNEIGAFESGVAASLMGLVPSIIFGGACTLVVAILTAALSPKLRRLVVETEKSD